MRYANLTGYSDVTPYEVVRRISEKTIEIRMMDFENNPDWKPEFVAGGFAANCVNQNEQKWIYKSNTQNPVIRARLRKDGKWHSAHGPHRMSDKPHRFYDYNF